MPYPDYYTFLEVDINSSENDIKKSYRKLAKKYHPDLNKNDKTAEENFKKINEAYNVLSNLAKRAEYDYLGQQENLTINEDENYNEKNSPTSSTIVNADSDIAKKRNNYNLLLNNLTKFNSLHIISCTLNIFLVIEFIGLFIISLYQNTTELPFSTITKQYYQNAKAYSLIHKHNYSSIKKQSYLINKAINFWLKKILFNETKKGNYEYVQKYINQYDPNIIDDENGYSLLMRVQDQQTINIMIKNKANVNIMAKDGYTALILALKEQNIPKIISLLNAKANVSVIDPQTEYSALMLAPNNKILEIMLKSGANPNYLTSNMVNPMSIQYKKNNINGVKLLQKYGAKVNWQILLNNK